jgi:hypothetical protein
MAADREVIVEWFCKYTYIRGPHAGRRGYSVSTTRDIDELRRSVAKHNADPASEETLEIWRKTTIEEPELG